MKPSNTSKFWRQHYHTFVFFLSQKIVQLAAPLWSGAHLLQPIKMSQGSLIFIKYFSFVSEFSGTDFFYKYNLNSQILCLPVCAGEDLGLYLSHTLFEIFCAENLTSKKFQLCRPSNKQTNRIVQTSNLRKINNSLKKASIFRNLEVFQILREISTSTWERKNKASGHMCPDFVQRG